MSTVSSSRILPNKYKEDATSTALTTRIPNANKFAVNVYSTDFSTSTEKFSVDKDKTLIDTVQLTNPLGIASGGTGLSSISAGYDLLQANAAGTAYTTSGLYMKQNTFSAVFGVSTTITTPFSITAFTFKNNVAEPNAHTEVTVYSSSYYEAIRVKQNGTTNGWRMTVHYDMTIDTYPGNLEFIILLLPNSFDDPLPCGYVAQVRDWDGNHGNTTFQFQALPGNSFLYLPWSVLNGPANDYTYGFIPTTWDRWVLHLSYFSLNTPP